ncbi:MAG: hypothetical protein IPP48_13095 [Chitinophagaceae bacterium]|nr:hypothetical protein [Chitinophagaceae bacterium]
MNIDYTNITTDVLQDDLFVEKQITVSVLRLDKIHPIISGNKLFKLYYFLEEAKKNNKTTLVTFGGAYSNHLAATSYACKLSNIKSVGIVRGEKPPKLSHTLQQCIENGMQLKFVSRYIYAAKEDVAFLTQLKK